MAVGFEWQSSWKIYKSDTAPQNDAQKKYFPKNTVLATGIGWKLVTDGADMEFVTDPITLDLKSQTDMAMDGESNLSATMASIEHYCADLHLPGCRRACGSACCPCRVPTWRSVGAPQCDRH